MKQLVDFLTRHGYIVLFAFVLTEQLGLPLPAVPALLAVGALIGRGHFNLVAALLLAAMAASMADVTWFYLGRSRGARILALLCRLSLEPDSCVRRSKDRLAKIGARSLLLAKFVPGLSTVATPVAGMSRVPFGRFIFWDLCGSLLWASAFLLTGVVFSAQLERAADLALRMGWALVILLGVGLFAFLAWKYGQRRRVLRSLRVARIMPQELKQRLDAGERVTIIDLRHDEELASDPATIPGALRYSPAALHRLEELLPNDQEVVLFCT